MSDNRAGQRPLTWRWRHAIFLAEDGARLRASLRRASRPAWWPRPPTPSWSSWP